MEIKLGDQVLEIDLQRIEQEPDEDQLMASLAQAKQGLAKYKEAMGGVTVPGDTDPHKADLRKAALLVQEAEDVLDRIIALQRRFGV